MTSQLHDHRYRKALHEADLRDSSWFRRHPDRIHRVRASRAFEMPDWGPGDHLAFPHMLVKRLVGQLHRRPAQFVGEIADDEVYLRQVWDHIDFIASLPGDHGKSFALPHEARLAMLRAAGIEETARG